MTEGIFRAFALQYYLFIMLFFTQSNGSKLNVICYEIKHLNSGPNLSYHQDQHRVVFQILILTGTWQYCIQTLYLLMCTGLSMPHAFIRFPFQTSNINRENLPHTCR